MKGVIIAAGFGKRMWPATEAYPKIFHQIYDKPTVFYNLTNLIAMGITDICIVGTPEMNRQFKKLFSDSLLLKYLTFVDEQEDDVQGTATSIKKAEKFVGTDSFALFMGDCLFVDLTNSIFNDLREEFEERGVSLTITVPVKDARAFSYFNGDYIIEKGSDPTRKNAVPGFYIFKNDVFSYIDKISKSERNEYEIVSAINLMVKDKQFINAGHKHSLVWMDTGSMDGLKNASTLIALLENITGRIIGSPYLELLKRGILSKKEILDNIEHRSGQYAEALKKEVSQQ